MFIQPKNESLDFTQSGALTFAANNGYLGEISHQQNELRTKDLYESLLHAWTTTFQFRGMTWQQFKNLFDRLPEVITFQVTST